MQKNKFVLLVFLLTAIIQQGLYAEDKPLSERLQFKGDFRYRHEKIDQEGTRLTRTRHRLRLRLAMQAWINNQFDINARIASGVGEPQSTNQDLTNSFSQKAIWIDRAYFDYHPFKQAKLLGGKFMIPIETTDLAWDPDLNAEGMAANLKTTNTTYFNFFGTLGGFWLSENSNGAEQELFLAQAGVRGKGEKLSWQAAAGYNDYGNLKNHPVISYPTNSNPNNSFGNTTRVDSSTTPSRSVYVEDFNVVQINGALTYNFGKTAVTVNADMVNNTAADDENMGWLAGVVVKGSLQTHPWQLGYNYRTLEKDATVGIYTDSDFAGGRTNAKGHKFWAGFSPLSHTNLLVTYFNNTLDPDGLKLNYQRLMADLILDF